MTKYQFTIHVNLKDARLCDGCPYWDLDNYGAVCRGGFGRPGLSKRLKSYTRSGACIREYGPWIDFDALDAMPPQKTKLPPPKEI